MTTATDLVPVDNMSALDSLDPQTREVAITSALEQANAWLAHVDVATSAVEDIANFKAYVATVAEASRRLKVSKECQMHAEVVVRRSERALGLSIRAGQERGEIGARSDGGAPSHRTSSHAERVLAKPSPRDFLSNNGQAQTEIYALTDDVSDEQFDEALDRAQAEENVSRANVVRKVREVKSGAEVRADKWARVADLAEHGWASAQIAREIGMTEQGLRTAARQKGIEFPADKHVLRSRRLDMRRVLEQTVTELAAIAQATDSLVSPEAIRASGIDGEEIQEWVDSLTSSIKALSKAVRTIKESIS